MPLPQVESTEESTRTLGRALTSEPSVEPLALFGFEFSLARASLDELEAVSRQVTRDQLAAWFSQLSDTEEVTLLSTCHRVEVVVLGRSPEALATWRDALPGRTDSWVLREGPSLVHHIFRVAAGLESLARGEAEVREQVRAAAYRVQSRHPRPILRELFLDSVSSAEKTGFRTPESHSIAAVASERLAELLGRSHPKVVVVGSGTMGRRVVEQLVDRALLTLVYHRRPPSPDFLRTTGARAVPFDQLRHELQSSDALVTAAKFGDHGLHASDFPRDRPVVVVDLGMPRNVDPRVRELANVRLVDLEELFGRSRRGRGSSVTDSQVEASASRHSERLQQLLVEPWVASVRRSAEEVRRAELDRARAFLGPLDPHQMAAVDRLTRRLVARLLLSPTERMRSLPSGPEGEAQLRLAVELFRPRSTDL